MLNVFLLQLIVSRVKLKEGSMHDTLGNKMGLGEAQLASECILESRSLSSIDEGIGLSILKEYHFLWLCF